MNEIEKALIGVPETAARVRAARSAEAHMRVRILLTMQRCAERNQSPGISPRIGNAFMHASEVVGDHFVDVGSNPSRVTPGFAEAVKSQILLRLVERIRNRIQLQGGDGVMVLVHSLVRTRDRQRIGSCESDGPREYIGGRVVDIRFVGLGRGR